MNGKLWLAGLVLLTVSPLTAQELVFRGRLEGSVLNPQALAFSQDGKTLACGGDLLTNEGKIEAGDGVDLWDMPTGKKIAGTKECPVKALAFTPDGKMLAAGSLNKVDLLDARTCAKVASLNGCGDWAGQSLAISPDGAVLASGEIGDIQLWDLATRKRTGKLVGEMRPGLYSVAFSPDGKTLAAGSGAPGSIFGPTLWDVGTQKKIGSLKGHTRDVTTVTFSPDGKILASIAFDRTIKLWDVAALKCLATLEDDRTWVRGLVFSPDGNTIAVAAQDGVTLWDVHTHNVISRVKMKDTLELDAPESLAFSPDGKTLASVTLFSTTVELWDVKPGKKAK